MMRARLVRELRWFGLGFGIPFLLMIGYDLATRPSPLSYWRRLTTLEDTCSYGACFILSAIAYGLVRLAGAFLFAFQDWRRTR